MPVSKNRRSSHKGNRRKKSHEKARSLGIPTHPWPRRTQSQGPAAQTIARFMGDPMPPADSKTKA